MVADPVSGRSTLQPGRTFFAVADGPVVTELVQDGQCVVSAYATVDALWTRVLDTCPPTAPALAAADGLVTLTWPTRTERLDLASGRTRPAIKGGETATAGHGKVLARVSGLTAVESRKSLHTNPFNWGQDVTIIRLQTEATGDTRAQIVSRQRLTLLSLDKAAVVVRDGSQVIRYTLDQKD